MESGKVLCTVGFNRHIVHIFSVYRSAAATTVPGGRRDTELCTHLYWNHLYHQLGRMVPSQVGRETLVRRSYQDILRSRVKKRESSGWRGNSRGRGRDEERNVWTSQEPVRMIMKLVSVCGLSGEGENIVVRSSS